MACHHERNCLFCGDKYQPDARNKRHQKYCSKPACRKASKAASHRAWLAKPENQNYFRSRENVARVQEWRATHPDYWRRSKEHGEVTSEEPIALQDVCTNEMVDIIEIPEPPKDVLKPALQDILMGNQQNQQAVLIGFIAHFMGSALQEDIEKSAHLTC